MIEVSEFVISGHLCSANENNCTMLLQPASQACAASPLQSAESLQHAIYSDTSEVDENQVVHLLQTHEGKLGHHGRSSVERPLIQHALRVYESSHHIMNDTKPHKITRQHADTAELCATHLSAIDRSPMSIDPPRAREPQVHAKSKSGKEPGRGGG